MRSLRISVQKESLAGQVVIVDVDSNGVASELLHPGDRILGCNGVLLAMQSPNSHLKKLLAVGENFALLRVIRGESVRDVRVEFLAADVALEPTRIGKILQIVGSFEDLVLNSSLAIIVMNRDKNGLTHTQLAIELDSTKRPIRLPRKSEGAQSP